ncbi:MAG: glycoside hydrolase family 1 protein [Candidatus Marinimicrobia bacterium]|nr:glycoside hydrolase family 1 protein [Candidatus Neomarinimicrobiota bacterium]MDG2365963.1 glycoside hydrolase family 1 protein [Candidatus Neomarinimicrobiota bacterium]
MNWASFRFFMIKKWFYILLFPLFLLSGYLIINHIKYPEVRWNWDQIDETVLDFPKGFQWGVATSAHQVEGNSINNWSRWEEGNFQDGLPHIHEGEKSGIASDHWKRFKEDILLIKELGVDVYRFSVEWSKIEPEEGLFSKKAIQHYQEVCDALLSAGIKPVITLHHFTNPLWFEDLGAFEKEENIKYFTRFSEFVFEELNSKVDKWCTINEPAVYTSQGYFNGVFPPGKKDPQLAGVVMKNLLLAHTRVYNLLKSHRNGKKHQIGIVKNIFPFDPFNRWNPLDWFVSRTLDEVFNQGALDYFITGNFEFSMPGMNKVVFNDPSVIKSLDFIGLNNYSHQRVKSQFSLNNFFRFQFYDDEEMTDMPYPIYPEAIYRSIKRVSAIGKPIIITENGVADKSDTIRPKYIDRYLFAVSKAIDEGANIKGYYYWTLMDNFEWSEGYAMKFGLYEVDFKNQKRTLREGSKHYIDIISKF